jgi:hypothetical protein
VVTQQHISSTLHQRISTTVSKKNLKIPMDKSGLSSSVPPKEKKGRRTGKKKERNQKI